jgi:hypothetical protein
MDKPKTRYPRSVARTLRPQPCPDCQRMSHPRLREDRGGFTNEVDPDVGATWYCPDNLCNQHDGFWIEEQ